MPNMKIIARVHSDFPEKFGIPRQSGLTDLPSVIIFEPEYRVKEAFRGLELYSHIWILWEFSEAAQKDWSPTVRPPKLGGNTRKGVFSTRSPYRPNPIGLSAVRLNRIEFDAEKGPVLHISGADIMDNTPVFDIKPYLPYADSYPDAKGGFALQNKEGLLKVSFPEPLLEMIPRDKREGLISALSQDPRPAYQDDPERVYTMSFGGFEISFKVKEETLEIIDICIR
ncbi:MAG: tRNA (N6-threonylcarbamoyladenosine(37)-N6)-methyltransferase TrmO [Ruminococcaceae bacterium]|nr:tRNA (N6-threonylcarbamoyladenosine(37)-N6)-methyltransferase TrmO [Oscillospiraceae bacterium]